MRLRSQLLIIKPLTCHGESCFKVLQIVYEHTSEKTSTLTSPLPVTTCIALVKMQAESRMRPHFLGHLINANGSTIPVSDFLSQPLSSRSPRAHGSDQGKTPLFPKTSKKTDYLRSLKGFNGRSCSMLLCLSFSIAAPSDTPVKPPNQWNKPTLPSVLKTPTLIFRRGLKNLMLVLDNYHCQQILKEPGGMAHLNIWSGPQ